MEKIEQGDFVINPSSLTEIDSLIKNEMIEDISVFEDEVKVVIEKWEKGEKLTNDDQIKLALARDKWFFKKYDSYYSNKRTREIIISKKYDISDTKKNLSAMQKSLFSALKNKKEDEIESLKGEYMEMFPDQIEGIMSLFDLKNYFDNEAIINKASEEISIISDKIKDHKINNKGNKDRKYLDGFYSEKREKLEEIYGLLEDQTEYQYLLAHFIDFNSGNKELLHTFWTVMERSAQKQNNLNKLHTTRQGVLSQVASYKIFKKLGTNPRMSHPVEDAKESIDLWGDDLMSDAFQIKSSKYLENPMFVPVDVVSFPGVEIDDDEQRKVYNTKYSRELSNLKTKLSKYEKIVNKKLKGYLLIIPAHEFDPVTGEPSEEIIEFVREHMESLRNENKK